VYQKNIESVQFLRFVAAAIVVMDHLSFGLEFYAHGTLSHSFDYICRLGACGVHIFFVISGFVMVYSSFNGDPFSSRMFLLRRFVRIYPIYWIYATAYLVIHAVIGTPYDLSTMQIVKAFMLLPVSAADIIGPGWTLSFEVYFYLCFALAMMAGVMRGTMILTAWFVASVAIGVIVHAPTATVLHVLLNPLLLEFLAGVAIGLAVLTKKIVHPRVADGLIVAGILGFVGGAIVGYTRLPAVLMWGIPSILLVAGFVFKERTGKTPSLVLKFSWLGDSSYSLYLLHVLLIDLVIGTLIASRMHLPIAALTVGVPLLCIVVAILAYGWIEKPLTRWLRQAAKKRAVGRAVNIASKGM
jgi:exopolysaccharide production protein ExoZ